MHISRICCWVKGYIDCGVLKRIEPQDLLLVMMLLLMSLLCLAKKRSFMNLLVKLIAVLIEGGF